VYGKRQARRETLTTRHLNVALTPHATPKSLDQHIRNPGIAKRYDTIPSRFALRKPLGNVENVTSGGDKRRLEEAPSTYTASYTASGEWVVYVPFFWYVYHGHRAFSARPKIKLFEKLRGMSKRINIWAAFRVFRIAPIGLPRSSRSLPSSPIVGAQAAPACFFPCLPPPCP
jgi:hypothetical protein